jgi:hypothetical protein
MTPLLARANWGFLPRNGVKDGARVSVAGRDALLMPRAKAIALGNGCAHGIFARATMPAER